MPIIITAPAEYSDIINRFFASGARIDEDPATDSAHAALPPNWSEWLERDAITAHECIAVIERTFSLP